MLHRVGASQQQREESDLQGEAARVAADEVENDQAANTLVPLDLKVLKTLNSHRATLTQCTCCP